MASKRKIRRNACGRKTKYYSERDARFAAKKYRADFPGSGWINAYKCPYEHGVWHIGHSR